MRRLVLAAAALALAASCAPPAHAEPNISPSAVCARIGIIPTVGGIVGVVIDLADQAGISTEESGRVVAHVVLGVCPQYAALLQQVVDRWATKGMAI
jgi:hypothetical protein